MPWEFFSPFAGKSRSRKLQHRGKGAGSAILAIEQIPDHFASFGIHFAQRLALLGSQMLITRLLSGVGCAALRTAIRKSRLIGPQFEFFPANHTGFDRKTHRFYFIEARF